jgi:glycosyltransferase involved in cell wall biosynthesis
MKILFVSIPSIHAIRWIENLKDESHELYWFDILDKGSINISDDVKIKKITYWKKRKKKYIRGEYFLRKKAPIIYNKIQPYLETTIDEQLVKTIQDIKPDIVHSFEMQSCSYPILETMLKYPKLTWVYSCWGSDLFYYQNFKTHKKKIKNVLKRIQVIHTDCNRDYLLAIKMGFKGVYSGVIPGGTGYDLKLLEAYKQPIKERKIILVKGYEHTFGRALNVLKALHLLNDFLLDYKVVVFAAHKKVIDFVNINKFPFRVIEKDSLNHIETLKLMGQSKIYIGNSISDGMPNTLLEALIMNAFPIQSNPGNVTSEVIVDGVNGLLINDPNDIEHIKNILFKVLNKGSEIDFNTAIKMNIKIANERLDAVLNKKKVIDFYENIEERLSENKT